MQKPARNDYIDVQILKNISDKQGRGVEALI